MPLPGESTVKFIKSRHTINYKLSGICKDTKPKYSVLYLLILAILLLLGRTFC